MITLHTDIRHIPATAQGCVLVIGNFDGVHLGHRALIEKAKALAEREKAPLGVMTFEPHPRRFFQPEAESFRLTMPPMKQRLLENLGVDHLFSLEFDQALSRIAAAEFIDRILVQSLRARHIIVGEDFAFGRGREGTAETLRAAKKFGLSTMPPVTAPDGQVYSSSAVRELLRQGRFAEAEKMLGWPWAMEAPVIHGDKRGRTLGFPTANQDMAGYVGIPHGVYAVRVLIEGETVWHNGAASFGIRPMFQRHLPVFETFIFDFSREIYGKMLRVQPVKYLRTELRFKDTEALVAQMKEDCITAKAVLKSSPAL